jgi:hypothetical protein
MADHLISKRLLEVISDRSAGNGRSPGKPPFPHFQGHFTNMKAGPGRLGAAAAPFGRADLKRSAYRSPSSDQANAVADLEWMPSGPQFTGVNNIEIKSDGGN